jgi:glycerophosphoryl diester phosphodiesterase
MESFKKENRVKEEDKEKPLIVILGHRGEGCTNRNPDVQGKRLIARNDSEFKGKILPENSLSAFKSAFEHGADGFECDVFLSKNGVPMVIHDNQLARNVDGYHYWSSPDEDKLGNVSDYDDKHLQNVDNFSIGGGEKIPTLDELIQLTITHNQEHLDRTGRNLTLNIELKGDPKIAQATYNVVMKYVNDPKSPFKKEDFLFNSFDEPCLAAMKKIDSEMRCALGLPTKKLFGNVGQNWVPIADNYKDEIKGELIDISSKYGLDIVTSDLKEEVLGPLCSQKGVPINLAINALRVKQEAKNKNSEEAEWPELEREKKEVLKLVNFSEKYGVKVYYKSDNPGKIQEYIHILRAKKNSVMKGEGEAKAKEEGWVVEEEVKEKGKMRKTELSYSPIFLKPPKVEAGQDNSYVDQQTGDKRKRSKESSP